MLDPKKTNPTILVIEDDEKLIASMIDVIGSYGFDAIGVIDFSQAVNKLENQKFDCILLDIDLGEDDRDGGSILERLKKSVSCSLNRTTPVVLCSGKIEPAVIQKHSDMIKGALTKPYKLDSLMQKINHCIQVSR